jgi:hypothetical protein
MRLGRCFSDYIASSCLQAAHTAMQQVEEKKLDLDKSSGDRLARPLPDYLDAGDFLPQPQRGRCPHA